MIVKIGLFIESNKAQVEGKNKFFTRSNKATNHPLLPTKTRFDYHNVEVLPPMIHLRKAFKHNSITSQISM